MSQPILLNIFCECLECALVFIHESVITPEHIILAAIRRVIIHIKTAGYYYLFTTRTIISNAKTAQPPADCR